MKIRAIKGGERTEFENFCFGVGFVTIIIGLILLAVTAFAYTFDPVFTGLWRGFLTSPLLFTIGSIIMVWSSTRFEP